MSNGAIVPPIKPDDHEKPHDHLVEWWYFAGELKNTATNKRYGFEFTIASVVGLYQAYFSFIDAASGYLGYAYTSANPFPPGGSGLRFEFPPSLGDAETWTCEIEPGSPRKYRLHAGFATGSPLQKRGINLELTEPPGRKPLLHGNNDGVVDFFGERMGFYSRPRLDVKGAVKFNSSYYQVDGTAWMDHQWGSIALWNRRWKYLAAHFDDGKDLVWYEIINDATPSQKIRKAYWFDGLNWRSSDATLTEIANMKWQGLPIGNSLNGTNPALNGIKQHPVLQDQLRHPANVPYPPQLVFWEGYSELMDQTNTRVGSAFLELGGNWPKT